MSIENWAVEEVVVALVGAFHFEEVAAEAIEHDIAEDPLTLMPIVVELVVPAVPVKQDSANMVMSSGA
jgi:hypothetical protein